MARCTGCGSLYSKGEIPTQTFITYLIFLITRATLHIPSEGPNLTNQISRKLGVFDRKLEGSHSILSYYFNRYQTKRSKNSKMKCLTFTPLYEVKVL